jgi:Uma2 family endonuclease
MDSGVRELWLVDPDAHTIARVCPDAGQDELLGEDDSLRSDLLPGFTLQLARVFFARSARAR